MEIEKDTITAIWQEISILVRRATFMYRWTEMPLDRSAYLILVELDAHGPLGIGTLANSFQLDISTTSRQTASLETKGLVERLSDPEDGRVSLLQITPLGRTQMQEVRQTYHTRLSELLEDWSEEDRHLFGDLLSRYNKAITQKGKKRSQKII